MPYDESFKIYCSTIAGEAGASSDEAIKTVARSIITRIGFREWGRYKNAVDVIKNSGYDAYTDRASSPNYKSVYNSMSSGKLNSLSKKIVNLVEPIYNEELPDETGMLSLYYSPKAQSALHKKYPNKYKPTPPWNFSQLERVYIDGTEEDDFNWYRYKGDGTTLKIFLLDSANKVLSGGKIVVKVTDRHGKHFVKEYITNQNGTIPDIHARKHSTVNFYVGSKQCKTVIVADGKPKKVTLKHYECTFETQTIPHTIQPSIHNDEQKDTEPAGLSDKQDQNIDISLKEVPFNIKLIEGDTGSPLPNSTYYLEYKNNIKKHVTDSSGIDSNIRADICESINVLLDDDEGKKQNIATLAFPVTQDLNNTTKVLAIPVVSLSIKFVDAHNQPIPNYQFTTLYRGRSSSIRKANSQGIAKLKALAGQQLTIVDGDNRAKTTSYVTDGSRKWTIKIGQSQALEDSDTTVTSDSAHSIDSENLDTTNNAKDSDNAQLTVDKPIVSEREVITDKGPTVEVESDETDIVIKFVDEKTGKPLSGLSYYTESDKYGKNLSVTGSDGTRGIVHNSKVGVVISVIVMEDGKEIVKAKITAKHGHDEPYVFKAKKPKNYLFPLPIKPTADYKSGMRRFGGRRGGGSRKHAGADLYAPTGTKVRAMEAGVVLGSGRFYAGTDFVTIKHANHIIRYGELAPNSVTVKSGDTVYRGQTIGKVGKLIGINVPSNMLHLEMYSNPNDTSPLTIKGPTGGSFKRRSDLINPNSFLDNAER